MFFSIFWPSQAAKSNDIAIRSVAHHTCTLLMKITNLFYGDQTPSTVFSRSLALSEAVWNEDQMIPGRCWIQKAFLCVQELLLNVSNADSQIPHSLSSTDRQIHFATIAVLIPTTSFVVHYTYSIFTSFSYAWYRSFIAHIVRYRFFILPSPR